MPLFKRVYTDQRGTLFAVFAKRKFLLPKTNYHDQLMKENLFNDSCLIGDSTDKCSIQF